MKVPASFVCRTVRRHALNYQLQHTVPSDVVLARRISGWQKQAIWTGESNCSTFVNKNRKSSCQHILHSVAPGAAKDHASSSRQTCTKFFCSYGGTFLPRPSDSELRYVGGERHLVQINRDMSWSELTCKTTKLIRQAGSHDQVPSPRGATEHAHLHRFRRRPSEYDR